jgi:WD40 repeat protein
MSTLKSSGHTTTDGSMSVVGSNSTASASAAVSTAATSDTTATLTDQAVLEYLNAHGMSHAVIELKELLKTTNNDRKADDNKAESKVTPAGATPTTQRLAHLREQLETEDEVGRSQRSYLSKATGGGFGYDLDAAAPVAQWGVPDKPLLDDDKEKDPSKQQRRKLGIAEAKSYLDAFCSLQLWILSLPEDSNSNSGWQPLTENVVAKAHALLLQNGNDKKNHGHCSANISIPEKTESNDVVTSAADEENNDTAVEENKESDQSQNKALLANVISELIRPAAPLDNSVAYPIPPSSKPELLSVCFALLVHTYCELLEVGMETTAHVLRDAFKPVYDPIYGEQYKDLYHCNTTEDIVKLNLHNSQHTDALQNLRTILLQIAQYQTKSDELSSNKYTNPAHKEAQSKKLQEYSQTMGLLQQRHNEMSQRASAAFERMHHLPFLRRARPVRWQITMSNTTYGMLCQFLNNAGAGSADTSMLAMSTLLQTKCELHIERRDPLPFTPAVVLDDNSTASMSTSSRDKYKYLNKDMPVQWAAPSTEAGLARHKDIPFPKYYLDREYDDERTARHEKRAIEFNRMILVNGFRRLEALERKRDFDVMSKSRHTIRTETSSSRDDPKEREISGIKTANPLEPSILLSTLCANQIRKREFTCKSTSKSSARRGSLGGSIDRGSSSKIASSDMTHFTDFTWEESGIGITCAKLCQPDGRKVAAGCDDAGIRVWNLLEDLPKATGKTQSVAGDAEQVLLGHKNGFPVFDLSWNRDGRCLLSAGGDGSIRLWDTDAQGSFGEVVSSSSIKGSTGAVKGTLPSISTTKKGTISSVAAKDALMKASATLEKARLNPDMTVPGLRPETTPHKSGAALAVYRGHAPNTPIWSVVFAPCGYYFASAGSDATARLWVTDRPVPVRIFTGHTSNCVHSVAFHPNCNYILTGGEDKTVRLWDIQTGRCVRLLNGCPAGIHKVEIDPSGQNAVGADVRGTVHLWDLATGKKITELRGPKPPIPGGTAGVLRQPISMLHCLAFSPCGRALATGGDDRCVRIWDIRKETEDPSTVLGMSHKSFGTRRTMVLDLQYTKRNLLLGVGKFISGIPAINTIAA